MAGRGDNEQLFSDIELDFFYFMQYLCTVTIKSMHAMKKDRIIADFLAFLDANELLIRYFELARQNYSSEGVLAFLERAPCDSFIDAAFSWPREQFHVWKCLSSLWKYRYTNKFIH